MSTIGDNIQQMRKALGWTQEDLAKRMGYKSKSTINKIELGINDIPQNKIVKFAKVLGTTPANLMGWDDPSELNLQLFASPEPELTEGEQKWLDLYRQFSEESRELLTNVFDDFGKLPESKQQMALAMIRVALKEKK